ncbi:Lsr2 family protein [Curtobacterium sp. 9128]|uniref:histone-like nucleoid-structuring protein Lsr2 n=1 Tax=Curtobacterium sp. 9128 TaxID=1793722 RepID=UPI00119F3ECF|nr:Lsr2 family protein [Curtobacterium sp. 9128]
MAQKVTTNLVDDLTGDVTEAGADRTVQFSFDVATYDIDLSDTNIDALRGSLSDYVAAARKTSSRTARSSLETPAKGCDNFDVPAKIRAWAGKNGHEVAARGRISPQVRDAYAAAN